MRHVLLLVRCALGISHRRWLRIAHLGLDLVRLFGWLFKPSILDPLRQVAEAKLSGTRGSGDGADAPQRNNEGGLGHNGGLWRRGQVMFRPFGALSGPLCMLGSTSRVSQTTRRTSEQRNSITACGRACLGTTCSLPRQAAPYRKPMA